jgi:N-acetyl-anhydromuramyl-L-alanine amidase AmpD
MPPTIHIGSLGVFVKQWQKIVGTKDDGIFGKMTLMATKLWQTSHSLVADGIVGPKTWAMAGMTPTIRPPSFIEDIPFIPAKYYTKYSGVRQIDLILIHVTQNQERPNTAIGLAEWAKSGDMPKGKEVSWHFIADNAHIIQSISENNIAWHAGRVNAYSIGIEIVGMSNQSIEEWEDNYSDSELLHTAKLCAILCMRHNLPVQRPTINAIRDKTGRGIAGHWDITKAFAIKGGHIDPGFNFPWDNYLQTIKHNYDSLKIIS